MTQRYLYPARAGARLIALAAAVWFALATGPGAASPSDAEPPDGETVMVILRDGLAYDASGDAYAALSMFGQACEMNLPAGCTMAGQIEHELASSEKDHIRAARMFAKACRAGDDLGCERTGIALGPLSRANSTEPEGLLTLALLRMGEECRHDNGEQACVDAAQLLGTDDEIGIDLDTARTYAKRACVDTDFPACVSATMLPAEERSEQETFARRDMLCATGWAGACDALAEPLIAGTAGDDGKRSLAVLGAACEDQVGIACANLGLYYSQGPEETRDLSLARNFFRFGCDGFVAKACFAFGVMKKQGTGGPVNETRAVSLVGHACELGHPDACATLVRIAEQSDEGVAAGISAKEAARRACRLGHKSSCLTPIE